MRRKSIVFIISFLVMGWCFGQSMQISGRVLDDDTDEGVPFCNIYFDGTTQGVSSDIDGYFTLQIEGKPSDSLVVTAISYTDQKKWVSTEIEQTINFRMKSSSQSLTEVVVYAGENPANAIVKGIIKNKPKNNINSLESYQCENYTKLELDLDNFDQIQNRKLLKQFDFVFENVDSTSDVIPFLPAFITETISDVYYVQGEPLKEIPTAMKVSGVSNQTVVDLVNGFQERYNVYDNWINVMGKELISPFSNTGLAYYEYYILDSMMIDGYQSIKLKFKPKRKQENTFYGDFWVADSVFAVQRVNMRMSEDVNINFVSRVIIYDEFNLSHDSLWLPHKSKMVLDFDALKNSPGIIGRRTTMYKDYVVNQSSTPSIYKEKDPEEYTLQGLEKNNDFWDASRHENLAANEMGIYKMIDSIQEVPIFKTYSKVLYTLASGWLLAGPVEYGKYYNIYSSNQVEGSRLALSVGTSNKLSKIIRFEVTGAYGFRDDRFKYGGNFQWNVRKGVRRTVLRGGYKNDVSYTNNSSEDLSEGSVLSSFYRNKVVDSLGNKTLYEKLLNVKEGKLSLEHDWKRGWSNKLTLLYREMDPYGGPGLGFDYSFLSDPSDPTNIDTTITSTELIFNTRYAFKENILQGEFDRTSLGSKYPIMTFQYTLGIPNLFQSEYSYHKFVLGVRHYFYTNPFGWTEYLFKTGVVTGTLPHLLLESHPGNETFFFSQTSFNTMNRFEFVSDKFVTLQLQHHLDGWFFNKIPGLRKLDLRLVGNFKAAYGHLSAANKAANRLNFADFNKQIPVQAPGPVPFMEAGVGIENIFKIIRVDAIWRLTYLDNPEAQKFTVRFAFDFNF